jgi:hypothetical protein
MTVAPDLVPFTVGGVTVLVTAADAAALDADLVLYGSCYVESFEGGHGARVDPLTIVVHHDESIIVEPGSAL